MTIKPWPVLGSPKIQIDRRKSARDKAWVDEKESKKAVDLQKKELSQDNKILILSF